MSNIETTQEERHFNKVYWFVVAYSALLTALMAAIVFCHVQKENTQMANMTLSYVFGLISGVTGVIVITNSDKKRDALLPPGTQQAVDSGWAYPTKLCCNLLRYASFAMPQ